MVLNDSSGGSYEEKVAYAVQFDKSNELLQTLSYFNQPVSSEKVDFCKRNNLITILQSGGLGFPSFVGNMFV